MSFSILFKDRIGFNQNGFDLCRLHSMKVWCLKFDWFFCFKTFQFTYLQVLAIWSVDVVLWRQKVSA